jgi:UDP-N-acetyl-D-glucosamine dehydrogenase
MNELFQKIGNKTALVGVIGQGYVGLPLALVFCEAGFTVTGFDLDASKIEMIARGESYIKHIGPERVASAVASGRYEATTDFSRLRACDAVLICVPTLLGPHREPDNSYIHSTAREIAKRLRYGQLVILESTTYPGTTDIEVKAILEESGLQCSKEFLLAFSPEREDPGRRDFTTKSIPKVVGGVDPTSTEAATALYGAAMDRVVPVSSARVAESAKLLENIFRSVNIALVNELKVIFDRMGIDVWDVIEAAKTKPFGFMPFYPGPGLGGHCIPLDPFYLSWKAAEHGHWTRFIELAGEINTRMPEYVVGKVVQGLNQDGKPLKGSRVLVLGLSYKANIDDDRESPSYEILELLRESGAVVSYCDPFFPRAHKTRKHDLGLESIPLTPEAFAANDAVVISTAHDQFKDASLLPRCPPGHRRAEPPGAPRLSRRATPACRQGLRCRGPAAERGHRAIHRAAVREARAHVRPTLQRLDHIGARTRNHLT